MADRFLEDATTRSAVFLQRKATGDYRRLLAQFDKLEKHIAGTVSTSDFIELRKQAVLLELMGAAREIYAEIGAQVIDDAIETAEYTARFEARLLERAGAASIITPDTADVARQVLSATMTVEQGVSGLNMAQAIQSYGSKKAAEVANVLTDALLTRADKGETVDLIQSLLNVQKSQAESLVRTAQNSASQTARMATFAANADVVEGYEWVAKLDSRTTEICKGLDGNVYPLGAGPRPPAHWGCRSQIVPIVINEV